VHPEHKSDMVCASRTAKLDSTALPARRLTRHPFQVCNLYGLLRRARKEGMGTPNCCQRGGPQSLRMFADYRSRVVAIFSSDVRQLPVKHPSPRTPGCHASVLKPSGARQRIDISPPPFRGFIRTAGRNSNLLLHCSGTRMWLIRSDPAVAPGAMPPRFYFSFA
jgi:hypothetical protein